MSQHELDVALCFAVKADDFGAVDVLLKRGAKEIGNPTPLWDAASRGKEKLVKLLIQHDADVNYRYAHLDGESVLCVAVHRGHTNIVPILVICGAELAPKEYEIRQPINFAQSEEIVALLFAAGAQPTRLSRTPERIGSKQIEHARRLLRPINLIRKQATEICIAFQSLDLPALVTVFIVDEACLLADFVSMFSKWELITSVKHFHDRVTKPPILAFAPS